MTWIRDRQSIVLQRSARQLLVVLLACIAITSIVAGCSAATRYRIKTIVFTGVPPLHGEESAAQTEQGETQGTDATEQMIRQQQHREALVSRYWQHGPFAAGECERCHSLGESTSFLGNRNAINDVTAPVASASSPSRLLMPPERLCVSCHTQHGTIFARDRDLQQHPLAAAGECTRCHNPHQSLRRYMLLRTDNRELCGSCHDPGTLSSVHSDDPERDCISCHNAHVGTKSNLLRSDAQELTILYGRRIDE
jgi:predicted CXXCH cytochrome family protein